MKKQQKKLKQSPSSYVEKVLKAEKRELAQLQSAVQKSLAREKTVAKNLNTEFDNQLTFGQRLADKIAEFGGSWKFITIFGTVLFIWILINSVVFLFRAFDPFPFILLNLILSCLAAIQAPIIMMSQNRQEAKDRMRAKHDYDVNVKAEREIRNVNAKIDQLLSHHWQRLLEIQQIQIELMQELKEKKDKN